METSLMILCIILGGAALFSVIHCLLLKRQIRDIQGDNIRDILETLRWMYGKGIDRNY